MIRSATLILLASLLTGCVTTGQVDPLSTPEGRAKAVESYIQLALGYLRTGSSERAKDPLKKALEIEPGSSEAHAALGLVFQMEKEPQHADEHYRKALAGNPDPRILNNYGGFLFETGRYAEAYSTFQRAVEDELYSDRSRIFENLGLTAIKLGRQAEAQAHFEKSLRLNRRQPRVMLELASLHYERGDYVPSRKYFTALLKTRVRPDARALLLGYRLSHAFRDPSAAASYAEQLQRSFPGTPEARQIQAELQ